jgi:hypothetical protein
MSKSTTDIASNAVRDIEREFQSQGGFMDIFRDKAPLVEYLCTFRCT